MNGNIDRKWVWIGGLVLLAVLCVLPFTVKNFRVFQFNMVMIYAIAIFSLASMGRSRWGTVPSTRSAPTRRPS
jgi:hypothetical protein